MNYKSNLLHDAIKKCLAPAAFLLPITILTAPLATADETESEQTKGGFEVITVTSRKMPESLQKAPIAVTAVTGDSIEARGFSDLSNIADVIPNVKIVNEGGISGGTAAANVFIRGVGQADFLISGDPGVGIYIDGVYYARTIGAAIDLVDLDQVEILRGPQGTLFGRNTIGGAINLTSIKPDYDDFFGKVKLSLGQEDYRSISASVNVPISENVAGRFSLLRRQHDGYVSALQYDDLALGNEDVTSLRSRITWQANDDLEFDFNVDYSEDNTNGAPTVATNYPINPNDAFFGASANMILDANTGSNCTTALGQNTNPSCYGPVQITDSKFTTNNTWYDNDLNKIKPFSLFENYGASLTATWAINDNYEFKSITAYRELDASFIRSTGHSPSLSFQNTTNVYQSEQTSQEFQLNGNSLDGRLHWVSGLYYFKEDGLEIDTVFQAVNFDTPGGIVALVDVRPNDRFEVENKTLALFGQGTYDITDTTHLTLGLRATKETKSGSTTADVDRFTPKERRVAFGIDPLEETNLTPHVSLSYDINDDAMGYFSFSQGFKSGTFSTRTPIPETYLNADGTPGTLPVAQQETVNSYEFGLKTVLEKLDLKANIALFRSDYEDIQVSTIAADGINQVFENGGDATIQGIEAELTYLATEDLTLSANIGVMDAKYTRIASGINLLKSTPIYGTPDYKVSLNASYVIRIGEADLVTNLDWTFTDEQALITQAIKRIDVNLPATEDNTLVSKIGIEPSYNFANLSIVYMPDHLEWSLSLFVKNLTDSNHRNSITDATTDKTDPFGVSEAQFARPREVQMSFSYNF